MFTHISYSTHERLTNQLPKLPARFIVLGYRDDESGMSIADVESVLKNPAPLNPNEYPEDDPSPPDFDTNEMPEKVPVPWYVQYLVVGVIVGVCVVLAIILWLLLGGGENQENQQKDQFGETCEPQKTNALGVPLPKN